ncbi:AraC family transcriptional regulator [Actinoallomurus rhizosphaericola]|uniref:AraC family transcriptional regulator n=1 Tax=Actinoallomurus rhizosphaericola TaxID=2952536 RepID=UPI0020926D7F|nr:AraC family transcriptional regulator [Actinoallomurus rhizosphaericola]MCO5995931.1 AraC family transcriptional regulator [Actinoallomurus rhizosphaericola]
MTRDWSRYWQSAEAPLEAMHAHFVRHVYHRHSHEGYSFGVTDEGAQAFSCRGGSHTSATGMVMAFNPEDPHDGRAADEMGFTYRMVHIGPELVTGVLADVTGRRAGLPLFREPVVDDAVLARNLRALHSALLGGASALRRDELLAATVASVVRRAAASGGRPAPAPTGARLVAARAREVIHDAYLEDLTAEELATAAGHTRFGVYRAFRATYGMAPSDYQRQLRLREARRLIALGRPLADVAAHTGFADQSHLTRWFVRWYGITPGRYRRASRPTPH